MQADVVFAGLAVADLEPALAWYERLFGRAPDLVPNDTEACWQLATGGWIYVVLDPERAGRGIVTLIVTGLEAVCDEIRERGLVPGPIAPIGGAGYKALLTDPAGNTVALAEPTITPPGP
ncbi:MAG TPA: VOC family protein [Solirubrobacteraceae bacterium]|jgi:glyoxylase I family protein|nr:VOC family protein [Solirubrobacteraceae bacterium]